MAYFPENIKTKSELQEHVTNIELSCDHLTTMNFGELNVAYYRHNTPREHWEGDISVFARPYPIQMPVMAKAEHHLKYFYVPFRTLSPQWNAFINKSPYLPANATSPIQVAEMPYFTTKTLTDFITNSEISSVITTGQEDFQVSSTKYKLTTLGRYAVKILRQLGYGIILDDKGSAHIDAMGLLAYAKVYMDFYYSNTYLNNTAASINVQNLFKKDANTAYALTVTDLLNIFKVCKYVFYAQDYFTSCFDNPMAPTSLTDVGTIKLFDITNNANVSGASSAAVITNTASVAGGPSSPNYKPSNGTPFIGGTYSPGSGINYVNSVLTQYAIDSLKKMTDYCVRFAMAGVREVDRYLARFGVLLSSEKMRRAVYFGEQITPMEFGSIFSNAATNQANLGDYAGQGIINSDGKEHKHCEIDSDEYGIIIVTSSIIPKIGYYQGMDRNNLHHEVESYFSGIFDQLGTQAVSAAELYIGHTDAAHNKDGQLDLIFGYLPRGVEYKTPRDRLTGDFNCKSINAYANVWHLFREFDDSYFTTNGMVHSPVFCQMGDAEQYLRIFDEQTEEAGDHFNVIYQIKANANIHAKPLYDSYDFESEGKEILLGGNGPKQN